MKDTLTTVDAMKGAHKALKAEVKKVKIDQIEVRRKRRKKMEQPSFPLCVYHADEEAGKGKGFV